MVTVKVQDIRGNLESLLHQVEAGETVIITRDNQPIAEVKPVQPRPIGRRPFGLCAGQFVVPDDFNDPLPDSILDAFEGK